MWDHDGFSVVEVAEKSFGERIAMKLMENRFTGSVAAELIRSMVLGTDDAGWQSNPMLPETVSFDRVMWGHDMQRSMQHYLVGQVQSFRLTTIPSSVVVDWSAFTKDIPVHVFFGEKDDVIPPPVATFTASKLPWATLHPFPGTHFDLDLFEVVRHIF